MAPQSADEVLAAVVKCVDFAAIKHKNQKRKDPQKTPYINHPIGKEHKLWGTKNFGGYVRLNLVKVR